MNFIRMLVLAGIVLAQVGAANAQFGGNLGNLINKVAPKPKQQTPDNSDTTNNSSVVNSPAEVNTAEERPAQPTTDSASLPPLFEAARKCDEAQFAELLKKDMSSVNKTAEEAGGRLLGNLAYYTPLYFAAKAGCTNIIQQLLDLEVKVDGAGNPLEFDNTPLTQAAGNGHLEAVKMLLKAGAEPYFGLNAACEGNQAEVVKTLFATEQYAPPGGSTDVVLQKLLIKSSTNGNVEILKLVLKEMAKLDPQKQYRISGRSSYNEALGDAVSKGQLDVVRIFVADGADLSLKDRSDRSLNQRAIEGNQPEMLA